MVDHTERYGFWSYFSSQWAHGDCNAYNFECSAAEVWIQDHITRLCCCDGHIDGASHSIAKRTIASVRGRAPARNRLALSQEASVLFLCHCHDDTGLRLFHPAGVHLLICRVGWIIDYAGCGASCHHGHGTDAWTDS